MCAGLGKQDLVNRPSYGMNSKKIPWGECGVSMKSRWETMEVRVHSPKSMENQYTDSWIYEKN